MHPHSENPGCTYDYISHSCRLFRLYRSCCCSKCQVSRVQSVIWYRTILLTVAMFVIKYYWKILLLIRMLSLISDRYNLMIPLFSQVITLKSHRRRSGWILGDAWGVSRCRVGLGMGSPSRLGGLGERHELPSVVRAEFRPKTDFGVF